MTTEIEALSLLMKDEPLHPDLAAHLHYQEFESTPGEGCDVLHHPLLISIPYNEAFNAHHNRYYLHKKEATEKAVEEKNWGRYIFSHERPYRVPALLIALQSGLERGSDEFWQLVGEVWTDTENVFQERKTWEDLWRTPGAHVTMCAEETAALAKMPATIKIWRGIQREDAVNGLSWTLDREKAKWFARQWLRKNDHPLLVSAQIKKQDVKAYFTGRGESEIVALPEAIQMEHVRIRRLARTRERLNAK